MADEPRNEDQEQITDENMVGKAEHEEFDDVDEFDDDDQDQDEGEDVDDE